MFVLFLVLFSCRENKKSESSSSTQENINNIINSYSPEDYSLEDSDQNIEPIDPNNNSNIQILFPQKIYNVMNDHVIVNMLSNSFICPALVLSAFLKFTCKKKCTTSYPKVTKINNNDGYEYQYEIKITNKDNLPKNLEFIFLPKTFQALNNSNNLWNKEEKITVSFQEGN